MPSDFSTFFHTATGHAPYAYQCRLACGEEARIDVVCGTDCRSQLVEIPAGLGKMASLPGGY